MMLETYKKHIKSCIIICALGTKSGALLLFAFRASVLDPVAFVPFSLFKTKTPTDLFKKN
ncbi:hypothetical protein Hanom_Chr06g00519711 [Helianthus anomalus]